MLLDSFYLYASVDITKRATIEQKLSNTASTKYEKEKIGLGNKLEVATQAYPLTILSSEGYLSSFKNRIMTRIEGKNCEGYRFQNKQISLQKKP